MRGVGKQKWRICAITESPQNHTGHSYYEVEPESFKFHGVIYQSINQSNFYSANIPGVARLSGATDRSVFKYKVVEAIP